MFKKKKKIDFFTSVIIAAAGSGKRMGADVNKIFLPLSGAPVLAHTLSVFQNMSEINEIILVAAESEIMEVKNLAEDFGITKVKTVVAGGKERMDSVKNGLSEVSESADIVLVHDAARPLIKPETVLEIIENIKINGAAACGAKNKNTVKRIDDNGFICETLDREYLVDIQTPQGFKKDIILSAYAYAEKENFSATDDCMVAEFAGVKVKVVFSTSDNLKITTYDDLAVAEQILQRRGIN